MKDKTVKAADLMRVLSHPVRCHALRAIFEATGGALLADIARSAGSSPAVTSNSVSVLRMHGLVQYAAGNVHGSFSRYVVTEYGCRVLGLVTRAEEVAR